MTDTKRKAGRPLKFSLADLQAGIAAYFDYCGVDKCGYPIDKEHKPPTITGLACHLDTTRDLLVDYEDKPQFSDTIKKAKQRILSYNEAMLYNRQASTAGIIFSLKNNWGYTDNAQTGADFGKDYKPVQIVLPDNGR